MVAHVFLTKSVVDVFSSKVKQFRINLLLQNLVVDNTAIIVLVQKLTCQFPYCYDQSIPKGLLKRESFF